ncbi:phosphonate ABC transporter, permease protein PhnE [Demequina sp. SO4-18]|uniref:phosphonate ABC transporter, permease protein PhnE n=1 Tax=Demequina sp. SO4-18 TaxID=3401026 RepID=UPI003B5CA637
MSAEHGQAPGNASRGPLARTPRPKQPSKTRSTVAWIALAVIFAGGAFLSNARWSHITGIFTDGARYFRLMGEGLLQNPLSEPYNEYWVLAFEKMMESVYMAWVGTMLGAVISIPFGFLAARNVAGPITVQITRVILNAIRAVPELVFVIVIMLPIFGFGPVAGAIALGVGAVGTLGKLTAEALEGIDPGPVEAGQASGASRWAILRWGYWTQVLPEVLAFWLYRFEVNIRASAVLGIIGAGGIGQLLSQLFSKRDWDQIGITLVVIILVTIAVDSISGAIRHRIIAGSAGSTTSKEKAEASL